MTIEIINVLLALVLLVMVIYLNKTFEKRIKQVKSDYYTKGYTDGIDKMTSVTLEMFEDKKNKPNENEVL
tara:strand:+ start:656 stop:865 length:210 start_codon:yes stop_codon:yes gene_type:complete